MTQEDRDLVIAALLRAGAEGSNDCVFEALEYLTGSLAAASEYCGGRLASVAGARYRISRRLSDTGDVYVLSNELYDKSCLELAARLANGEEPEQIK